jgi:hypothetical protein
VRCRRRLSKKRATKIWIRVARITTREMLLPAKKFTVQNDVKNYCELCTLQHGRGDDREIYDYSVRCRTPVIEQEHMENSWSEMTHKLSDTSPQTSIN